jgi:hypothetical protein
MPADHGDGPAIKAALFREERLQLRAVAFRILGSDADVDDVLQEAWIRFDRTDTTAFRILGSDADAAKKLASPPSTSPSWPPPSSRTSPSSSRTSPAHHSS